jgi:hypothetical protein
MSTGRGFGPVIRIEPTATIDGDLSLLFELPEFIINSMVRKIQLFAEIFDCFRVL